MALSYGICFPSCHRNSDLLKFQKCSRAAQNTLAGRRLPTPGLRVSVQCIRRLCVVASLEKRLKRFPPIGPVSAYINILWKKSTVPAVVAIAKLI